MDPSRDAQNLHQRKEPRRGRPWQPVLLVMTVLAMAAAWSVNPSKVVAQPVSSQAFSAFGTGTVLGVNVLRLGSTQAVNAQVGFAGQSVSSTGLSSPIMNELGYAAQPSQPGKNAYGRGSGLEVGLLRPTPSQDQNQIILAGLAQASAPPVTPMVTKQIGPVNLPPLLHASLLRGKAEAAFDPTTCAVGRPFAFGEGEVAKVQVLNTGATRANGEFAAPLVETSLPANRNVAQSRTFSYLAANGDGTFGVVSETHQQVLPISLLNGQVTIELLGEWVLRTTATGKPGGAKVEYAPVGAGPQTPVLRLTLFGGVPLTLRLQQLLGPNGLDLSIPNLLTLRIGTPPRPIGSDASPQLPAPVAADGTSASAAVDVVRLSLLNTPGIGLLDLRLGHMEASVRAPAGGVRCEIPVSKTGVPASVNPGGTVTQTITIPSDGGAFANLFGCDLVNIRATDVVSVKSGDPTFQITGANRGGTISPDRRSVSWSNLGTYNPGDPPIVLTVTVTIGEASAAGVLQDTATVTADLGNCTGGAGGGTLVGTADLDGTDIGGSTSFTGPAIVTAGGGGGGGGTTPTTATRATATTAPASVLGNVFTSPEAAAAQPAGGTLSRTGFNVAVLLAVAALLTVMGGLVLVGRRWLYGS